MTITLEHLDPAVLIVGENVRGDARLDPAFLASVAEEGVIEAISAHRDPDTGDVVVDRGKRRTLAACRAGLNTVPVLVSDRPAAEVDRVVHQVVENEHRAGLTNLERVRAVEQLALLGVPAGQIARRVAIPKEQVAAAAKVAQSDTAVAHVDDAGVTLEQVAILAEFDGDEKATDALVQELQQWGGRNLAVRAERIREERAERAAIAEKAAELIADGAEVIERPEHGHSTRQVARLRDLTTAKGGPIGRTHATKCPGHRVWVERDRSGPRDEVRVDVVAACVDWPQHGHVGTAWWLTQSHGAKIPVAELSEEERESERLKRRHVVESNKDWKAAATVRRRWLTQFALRKTAPDGAEHLIAAGVVGDWTDHFTSYNPGGSPLVDILGTSREAIEAELATAAPKRAVQLALVLLLACWEGSLYDDQWRRLDGREHDRDVRVLDAITQWGHQLSDIEQRVVDGTAAEPAA